MDLDPRRSDKKLLLITGMPGAGKSTAAMETRELGFDVVVMGDIIREETASRGFSITDLNCGRVMKEIREEMGPSVIARLSIPKIQASQKSLIAIDGVRSKSEVDEFRAAFPSTRLLAILASQDRRYDLITKRSREDRPSDRTVFNARDERELKVGVGELIPEAEEVILNEKITLIDLRTRLLTLVRGMFGL
ncbi:MAG: AAA family ATPase [Nitrososphaerales archaeon]